MSRAVQLLLVLGILPSLTALSDGLYARLPWLRVYMGPINPLKVAFPLLLIFAWQRRSEYVGLHKLLAVAGAVFIVSSFTTSALCGFPALTLRETAVTCIGVVAALCLHGLSPRSGYRVVVGWASVIYFAVILDLLFPNSITWLYNHVFDPGTRDLDEGALGHRALTGIFGRQSLAKLLVWIPWLVFAFGKKTKISRRVEIAFLLLAVISTGLTLGTSQRGPFLGGLAAWAAYGIQRWIRFHDRRAIQMAAAGALASLVVMWVAVPQEILAPRLKSLVTSKTDSAYGSYAHGNWNFRKILLGISLKQIATHPLGNACIPSEVFDREGIYAAHSHSLLIHQFRERGWLWGLVHMLLWLAACWGAWRSTQAWSSALFAGLIGNLVLGLTDHPWWVLNHSMLLGAYLVEGLALAGPFASKSKAVAR